MKWNVINVWERLTRLERCQRSKRSQRVERSQRLPKLPNLNFGRRSRQTFLLGRNSMPNKMCLNVRKKIVDIILEKRWSSAQAEIHNQKFQKP